MKASIIPAMYICTTIQFQILQLTLVKDDVMLTAVLSMHCQQKRYSKRKHCRFPIDFTLSQSERVYPQETQHPYREPQQEGPHNF